MRVTDMVFGAMIMVVVVVLTTSAAVQMLHMSGGDVTTAEAEYEEHYGAMVQDVNEIARQATAIQEKVVGIQYSENQFLVGGEAIVEAVKIVPNAMNLTIRAISVAADAVGLPAEATGVILAAVMAVIALGVINFLRGGGQL